MLEDLKSQVYEANLELVRQALVIYTFGNVSAVDSSRKMVVIKPSGVDYDRMKPDDMVVVSLETGKTVEGKLRPSSDTPTHLEIYRAFPEVGGVVHTHSMYATAWAQACIDIPCLGTTHADYFHGPVPCTRALTREEIEGDYEENTGKVIVERYEGMNALGAPGVLVAHHGPFAWGKDASAAVHNAAILEYCARLASETLKINAATSAIPGSLHDRHFLRKHGAKKYYGQ